MHRLVIRRHGPTHAVCCLRHGQQGVGDAFGQHRVGLPGDGKGPVREKGGRQRARKVLFLALRQNPEVSGLKLCLAHHLFRHTGAHDAGIHFALQYGLDDLAHRQANEQNFLQVRLFHFPMRM